MFIQSKTMGVLLLHCIGFYSQAVAKVEIQSVIYDAPSEDVINERVSSWNQNSLAYAFCPNLRGTDPVSQVKCTIVLGSSLDDLRFCNVTVSATRDLIRKMWNYYQFGKDKVILQWLDYNNEFGYGIVEFNHCMFTPINVDNYSVTDGNAVPIQLNDHTYDIWYRDLSDDCDNWCRVTLDDKGNVIADPKHKLNSSDYIAVMYSPTHARLVVLSPWDLENITQIAVENDDGTIKILKEFPIEEKQHSDVILAKKYSVSTTYQLMTICSAINLTVYCGQFDENGTLKLENSIKISHVRYLNKVRVHNVLDGGFLLLFDSGDGQPIFVTKVNATGQEVGTLQSQQFPCYYRTDFHLYTNADKEPCLTQMCKYKDHLSFDYACYPDKAFEK